MALPHFNKAKASKNLYEPVHQNLFEVTFLPPSGITGGDLLLEHVNTVGGLDGVNPAVEAIGQKYKFSDRSYAGMPGQTYIDVAINFSLNLNEANQMYIYKTLRDWYKKIYDPATGAMGLKVDYTGDMIIVEYNRAGNIYRKLTLNDVFPITPPTGLDGRDYSAADALAIDMTFRCDYWTEELA